MLIWSENGAVIKKDWTPDRIGRAFRILPSTTQAEEFVQDLYLPPRLPEPGPPQAVEANESIIRLEAFLNR